MSQNKILLRENARKHRASIHVRADDFEAAANHFFDHIQPQTGQIISGYWPMGREFDPHFILERACKERFTCCLPDVDPNTRILRFIRWTPKSEMVTGAYNIPVPKIENESDVLEPDIVLMPLLAFDRRGYRLGQGGGYYDATLEQLRSHKNIQAVGMGYAEQAVLFNLPIEEHDQKLDWIITPQGAQRFM